MPIYKNKRKISNYEAGKRLRSGIVTHALVSAPGMQRQKDNCELEASLVHVASFWTVRT